MEWRDRRRSSVSRTLNSGLGAIGNFNGEKQAGRDLASFWGQARSRVLLTDFGNAPAAFGSRCPALGPGARRYSEGRVPVVLPRPGRGARFDSRILGECLQPKAPALGAGVCAASRVQGHLATPNNNFRDAVLKCACCNFYRRSLLAARGSCASTAGLASSL